MKYIEPSTQLQFKTGRWTHKEHGRYLEAVRNFGTDWPKISDFIGTRNTVQVRSHAQKFKLREMSKTHSLEQFGYHFLNFETEESGKKDMATQYGEGVEFSTGEILDFEYEFRVQGY